jgi:hypothetical protein
MRRVIPVLAIVAMSFVSAAHAQSPSPAADGAFKFYTPESIAAQFKELGYKAEPVQGGVKCEVKHEAGGTVLDLPMNVFLSGQGDLVELAVKIDDYTPDKLPAGSLKKILEANFDLNPVFFTFAGNGLWLTRFLDNRQRTAAAWRAVVEDLMENVVKTHDIWGAAEMKAAVMATPAGSPSPAASPSAK